MRQPTPWVTRWKRSPLGRSIVHVTLGNSLGQVALLVGVPFLVLVYPPAVLGVFASVLAVAQILSVVSTLSLERILPRIEEDARAAVLKLTLLGAIGVCALGAGVAVQMGYPAQTTVALVLLIASTSLMRVAVHSCLSQRRNGLVGTLRATNGVVTALAPLLLGLIQASVTALAVGYALGSLVATVVAAPVMYRQWLAGERSILEVGRAHRLAGFAGRVGPADLLTNAGATLPVVAVQVLFGPELAGTFYLVRRVLTTPLQTISLGINESVYSHVAKENPHELNDHLRRWIIRGFLIGGLVALSFMALAPVAGWWAADYPRVGLTILALSIPLGLQAIGASFSHILLVQRRESARLGLSALRLAGLAALFAMIDGLDIAYPPSVVLYGIWISLVSLLLVRLITTPVAVPR